MRLDATLCSLSLLLSVPAAVAIAQEAPSQVGVVNAPPGQMTGKEFGQAVMASDMFEIESGRLAADRAVSPDLRHFGEQMVDDHSRTTAHLKAALDRILTGMYVTPPPKPDPRHMEMYNDLQASHGQAFDALYLHQQLMAHREAVAVLQGYAANGLEQPLREFARDALPLVRHHLAMLRQIRSEDSEAAAR